MESAINSAYPKCRAKPITAFLSFHKSIIGIGLPARSNTSTPSSKLAKSLDVPASALAVEQSLPELRLKAAVALYSYGRIFKHGIEFAKLSNVHAKQLADTHFYKDNKQKILMRKNIKAFIFRKQ